MRILIPTFAYPDSFADNVAYTLRKMEHEVFTLPGTPRSRLGARLIERGDDLLSKLSYDYVSSVDRLALAMCRAVRPQVVLALTQQIAASALRAFKDLGVRHRVCWWGDAAGNMRQMGLLTDEWDLIFAKDRDCVLKLRRVGLNAHHLHEAHNPDWHRPIDGPPSGRVVVLGNFYNYRQFLVQRLTERSVPLELHGSPLPQWALPSVKRLHKGQGIIIKEVKSRAYSAGLACLNSMHFIEGNSLNSRAFEVAGAGGLQIIEHRAEIESCFQPGREVLSFNTFEELFQHIDMASRHPSDAKRIRDAGRRRALGEHTYEHRLKVLLAHLSSAA